MTIPGAGSGSAAASFLTWYLELLKSTSAFAERAISPPWSKATDRLRSLLLTTSLILALSIAGIPLGGDGLLERLAALLDRAPFRVLATALLVYGLLAYYLAGSGDLAVHRLILGEPYVKYRAALDEIQVGIDSHMDQLRKDDERRRALRHELDQEQHERDKHYKALMAKLDPADGASEEWLELDTERARDRDERWARMASGLVDSEAHFAFSVMANAKMKALETVPGEILRLAGKNRKWQYLVEFWGAMIIGLSVLLWSGIAFLLR